MCNNYTPPRELWPELGYTPDWTDRPNPHGIFPREMGPFIRASKAGGREQVVGQWALVPKDAPSPKLAYDTNNCRSEEMETKRSFQRAWASGQRCIIPADEYWEPCWETFSHVPWKFTRADGKPFALAGIWERWVDAATGEVVESYSMLTINADQHPLMSRMHKPDLKLPPDQQDKRMACVLEPDDWEPWLREPVPAKAKQLLRCAPAEIFVGAPEPIGPQNLSLF